jgi:hypothetical protein
VPSTLRRRIGARQHAAGSSPQGVVFDAAGNLYGTTALGGALGWGAEM